MFGIHQFRWGSVVGVPFGARFVGVPLGAPFVVVPWCGLSGVLWVLPVSVSCAGRLGPFPRAFVRAGCSPFVRGVRAAVSFLVLSLVFLFCRVAWYFSSPAMWFACVCVSPALLRPPPVPGALAPPFAPPRASYALRSSSALGLRSLFLPPALTSVMPQIFNLFLDSCWQYALMTCSSVSKNKKKKNKRRRASQPQEQKSAAV